jgi:membrane-associated phospholipid phosphatase
LLIVLAIAWNLRRRRRLFSGGLLYVGMVQFLSTTIADLSKPLFGRARPFQAIADGRWTDLWFAGPDYGSFPSGHVAFYAGLCVPLAILHRKFAAPLLMLPALVALQRLGSHDHYATDVGASILLAAHWLLRRAGSRNGKGRG